MIPLSRPAIAGKDKQSPGFPSSSHNFFFWIAREMNCLTANKERQRPGNTTERKQLIMSFPYRHGLSVNKCQLSAENEIQELSQLGREVLVHRSGGDSPGTQREGCSPSPAMGELPQPPPSGLAATKHPNHLKLNPQCCHSNRDRSLWQWGGQKVSTSSFSAAQRRLQLPP